MKNKKNIPSQMATNSSIKFILGALVVVVFSLFISRTLFTKSLARTDDLELHGVRVANYYLAIKQGQIPPYWGPNLNHGFGYPAIEFSYHLPYIFTSFFYALGLGVELSINLTIVLFIISGSVGIFLFSYLKNKNLHLAVISSLAYSSAPYLLLNIFVRGALGEISFLGILPWIFILLELHEKYKKWWYHLVTPLVSFLFFLSHPASLIIAVPILFAWFIRKINKSNQKSIFYTSLLIGLGISLASFFWIPFIFEKQFISIDQHSITSNYWKRYPGFKTLFWSPWGYGALDTSKNQEVFPTTFGISTLLIIGTTLFVSSKKKTVNYFWLTIFFLSLFLMLPISRKTWKLSFFLPYIQYPWRLLWVSVISSIMLLNSKTLLENLPKKQLRLLFYLLGFSAVYNSILFAKPISYINNSDIEWREHPGTTTSDNELNPKWFNLNASLGIAEKVYLREKNSSEIVFDERIKIVNWTGSKMGYKVITDSPIDIIQKTTYFPGWEVSVDGSPIQINYQDEEFPGVIIFPVGSGKHTINSKYTNNTPAKKTGIYLTIFSLFLWMLLLLKKPSVYFTTLLGKKNSSASQ